MIASHYAEPLERSIAAPAAVRAEASEDAEALAQLSPGDPFRMLDNSLGWAWGYAGAEGRVGYVRSEAVSPVP